MRAAFPWPMLAVAAALGAVGDGKDQDKSAGDRPAPVWKRATAPLPEIDTEAQAMAFVGEHHPELARVLEPLKAKNPAEYRKAVAEIAQVARNLADLERRNPRRSELALDAWKAKSRVELLAAQLAGSPTEELRSQLRSAIEAKVDAEIRRQRFDLEQAEAAARKLRQSLDRLENHRDAVVEARFRALQPKKVKGARGRDGAKPVAGPVSPSAASHRENRP